MEEEKGNKRRRVGREEVVGGWAARSVDLLYLCV